MALIYNSKYKNSSADIDVIFSPALLPYSTIDKSTAVVVIDIFRATTLMVTAFKQGVSEVVPFVDINKVKGFSERGYLLAGERNAEVIAGFDFGNSPVSISNKDLSSKKLAITTTNGTNAIEAVKNVEVVLIGAFTNISAIANFLIQHAAKKIVLLCAGWKNRFNIEDSLFAGNLVDKLSHNMNISLSDSAIVSQNIYENNRDNFYSFIDKSSHRKRLSKLNLEEDILYSLQKDLTDCVPRLIKSKIKLN